MHKDGFIVSIKNEQGNILRESYSCSPAETYLPFNSEYSIFLKNTHNRKAIAKITIDGTDVLSGKGVILNPYGSDTLERFILDGNLTIGKKFKFVPLSDSRVQDPTSSENGLIKVEFRLEKRLNISVARPISISNKMSYRAPDERTRYREVSATMNMFETASCNYYVNNSMPESNGATIEGSTSNQRFKLTTIGELEPGSTIITLQLKGYKEIKQNDDILVNDSKRKYCVNCGKRLRFKDNYCSKCGTKQ
jgi:hypothetical protein